MNVAPVTETEEAPALGIGPQIPDPAKKTDAPPPLFGTEQTSAAPPASSETTPENGTATTPTWDWTKADLRRGKPEDVPEEHRAEFTRLQNDFKNMQGENSRREADLRRREQATQDRERRLDTLEKRLATLAEQPPQTPATKTEAGAVKKKIAELLDDPETDPDTRSAILLMKDVVEDILDGLQVKDRLGKIDQVMPVIEKMTTQEKQGHVDGVIRQVSDAQEKYGKEEVDAYSTEIADALGLDANWQPLRQPWINRATGQPHTVTTLYEWFSGKTAAAAEAARAEDADIRTKGKKNGASPPARPTPPPSGQLSEAEAQRQAKALGFGTG